MTSSFFSEVLRIPGTKVLSREEAAFQYGADTGASQRLPAGAIIIKEVEAIYTVLTLENELKVPLFPIRGVRN